MKEKQKPTEEGIKPYEQPEWVKIILQLVRESKNPALRHLNEPAKH
jgi:hypothetical protein